MRLLPSALAAISVFPLCALADYREEVLREAPVAYWRFDDALDCCAREENDNREMHAHRGENVSLVEPGPRSPQFPGFDMHNVAAGFTDVKSGAFLRVKDTPGRGALDFETGSTITLEAWVQCRKLADGQNVYVIGKGRTGNPGVAANNQNWALRLRGVKGGESVVACPSFLFRDEKNDAEGSWHRWTAKRGFSAGEEWQHVVATYTFGKPDSAKAWVNGVALDGAWDMGGATTLGPVVDDDEVWIGGSMDGAASSQFPGALDEVAVYRTTLPQERISAHARREGSLPKLLDATPTAVPKAAE